jgi:hypothetical protein
MFVVTVNLFPASLYCVYLNPQNTQLKTNNPTDRMREVQIMNPAINLKNNFLLDVGLKPLRYQLCVLLTLSQI